MAQGRSRSRRHCSRAGYAHLVWMGIYARPTWTTGLITGTEVSRSDPDAPSLPDAYVPRNGGDGKGIGHARGPDPFGMVWAFPFRFWHAPSAEAQVVILVSRTTDKLQRSCALPLSLGQSQSWFEAHLFMAWTFCVRGVRLDPSLAAHPHLANQIGADIPPSCRMGWPGYGLGASRLRSCAENKLAKWLPARATRIPVRLGRGRRSRACGDPSSRTGNHARLPSGRRLFKIEAD